MLVAAGGIVAWVWLKRRKASVEADGGKDASKMGPADNGAEKSVSPGFSELHATPSPWSGAPGAPEAVVGPYAGPQHGYQEQGTQLAAELDGAGGGVAGAPPAELMGQLTEAK